MYAPVLFPFYPSGGKLKRFFPFSGPLQTPETFLLCFIGYGFLFLFRGDSVIFGIEKGVSPCNGGKKVHIRVSKFTSIGDRPVNEDSLLSMRVGNRLIFVVADGLGGHGLGDVASKLACETSAHLIASVPECGKDMFRGVYDGVQDALLKKQAEMDAEGSMRTTLNLLVIENSYAYWSHIGDSRTYFFENGKIVKRTFDHSVSQMMVALGEIQEEDLRFHEDRNRLLKVLGAQDVKPVYDAEEPVKLAPGQQFLLCSDGFWNLITEEQMLLCLEESDGPDIWMENMTELIRRNGSRQERDNITAIAVWIGEN